MLNISFIKKFFSESIKKNRINKIRKGFDVSKVWKKIFFIFGIINIIVVGVSVYLFFQINKGEIFISKENTPISVGTIDRAFLHEVIELFEMKEKEFDFLKTNKPITVDPSL